MALEAVKQRIAHAHEIVAALKAAAYDHGSADPERVKRLRAAAALHEEGARAMQAAKSVHDLGGM